MEEVEISPQTQEKNEKVSVKIRTTTDLQRLKLEKLMRNPDKPIIIPEPPKERDYPNVPDFVRNVMGSSAGAGSGEFHVYRHLRRKEFARQRYMKEKAEKDKLDVEYKQKLEENKQKAADKTARKRKKRLKRKEKIKNKRKMSKNGEHEPAHNDKSSESSDLSDEEDEDTNKT